MRTFTFEVDGKSYTIKYDYNAIADIEVMVGESITKYVEKESFDMLRVLLWGGLKWKMNGITRQQAGFLIEKVAKENGLKELIKGMVSTLQYALKNLSPEEDQEDQSDLGEEVTEGE